MPSISSSVARGGAAVGTGIVPCGEVALRDGADVDGAAGASVADGMTSLLSLLGESLVLG
jgi:hypothetical protein